jgi:hypothetical protein
MAAVPDTYDEQFGPASGGGTPDAQVVLGAVMVATIGAVAVAGYFFEPAAAAAAAVAMFPVLVVASIRTDLGDHSAYVALSERR